MLLPEGFDSKLGRFELLLVVRGELGLDVLGGFSELFANGGEPEEKSVDGSSWVREVNHNADYYVSAGEGIAVQGCLK